MKTTEITVEISLDYLHDVTFPHYSRNMEDKMKWLALHLGYTKAIRKEDKVIPRCEGAEYILLTDITNISDELKEKTC